MKNNKVIHFEVQADDIERAKKFYGDTFGWQIEKSEDSKEMDYWIIMAGEKDAPGINGGMYKRMPERKLTTFDCTILVEDIDKAMENIKKNGGKIEKMDGEKEKVNMEKIGWFARGIDTEGNIFGIMQPTEWKP